MNVIIFDAAQKKVEELPKVTPEVPALQSTVTATPVVSQTPTAQVASAFEPVIEVAQDTSAPVITEQSNLVESGWHGSENEDESTTFEKKEEKPQKL
jgi:hypothetical protein